MRISDWSSDVCSSDLVVKAAVGFLESSSFAVTFKLGITIRKRGQIGIGRSLCRPRRHVRRNCFAQFEQRAQIGVHKLQDQRERTGEIPGLRSRYHRTTAPAELEMNNALEFEEPERLAQ